MHDGNSGAHGVQVGARSGSTGAPARARVVIGFGSPAGDSGVTRLDLNDILVRSPQATFLMRVAGTSMHDAGLADGDLVLVDRSLLPAHGHVVVAVVEQEFVCRHLVKRPGDLRLRAADPAVADIVPNDGDGLEIWGVVTTTIRTLPV